MADRTCTVDGRRLTISHPDKVLFPDNGLTKGDLATYYRRVAPVALPHCQERPLTMERYPHGIADEGFIHKDAPAYFPDWIARARLPKAGGTVAYVVANDAATLVYLADQGCITPHVALARRDRPHHPDRMILDLDPSDDDFEKVRWAARRVRALLDRLELPAYVQTTGSRGLHVVVPLDRSADFDAVRKFARQLAERLAADDPERLTVAQRKQERGPRVYLDTLRNAYGQTAVAPYAVRARAGAPVATPLRWRELGNARLHPRKYTVRNLFRRMGQTKDPWADLPRHAISLDTARDRLKRLPAH